MDSFIRRENIKRYRKLLETAKNEAERARLEKLLAEEQQKQADAGDNLEDPPRPLTALATFNAPGGSVRHGAPGLLADPHAAAAGFGADAAMFVLARMLLAFVRTHAARRRAGVKHAPDHFVVRAGVPRRHAAGDIADIRAIEIEANALCQRLHAFLREAGVGAGRTGLRAGITLLDAINQGRVGVAAHGGVRADHLLGLHGNSPGCVVKRHLGKTPVS